MSGDVHELLVPYSGIVIQPGDRVLVAVEGHPSQDQAQELCDRLKARFPGAEFTVVAANSLAKMDSR